MDVLLGSVIFGAVVALLLIMWVVGGTLVTGYALAILARYIMAGADAEDRLAGPIAKATVGKAT